LLNPKGKKSKKMGKAVLTESNVAIPSGVEVVVRNRMITASGPRGKVTKSFPNCSVLMRNHEVKGVKSLNIAIWFKNRKNRALTKTMASLVENMIVGVTKGYRYVMKYGHKRHPMKPASAKDGKSIQVANYLGSQYTRVIKAPAGVTVECDPENQAKEIFVTGIDNEMVGTTCAMIHQSCRPRNLDRRKFEDGLYIQTRGTIDQDY
jgi:large subunit ribosomal protein L9e